jgi:hypothetical protein
MMSTERTDLLQILEIDETNLKGILADFRQNGFLEFFERLLALLDSLSPLVQEYLDFVINIAIHSISRWPSQHSLGIET